MLKMAFQLSVPITCLIHVIYFHFELQSRKLSVLSTDLVVIFGK